MFPNVAIRGDLLEQAFIRSLGSLDLFNEDDWMRLRERVFCHTMGAFSQPNLQNLLMIQMFIF